MNRDWMPDVVDANTIAWDTFTATLDLAVLELERTTKSAPLEVVMHDLRGERFGSRRHNELLWRHELVKARSRKVLDDYKPEPVLSDRQLQIAVDALNGVGGFAKGLTGDVTASSDSRAPKPNNAPRKAQGREAA